MASQEVGTVYVRVVPSGLDFGKTIDSQLTSSIDNVSQKGSKSIVTSVGGAFSTIGKAGLGVIGTVVGGLATLTAKGGFERALSIEKAQAKLKGLGHSSEDVTLIMQNALASVKGTAYGLGDAATVAASLSAAGIASGNELERSLKAVADTAQISGRSLTDIGTIFGSVAAKGKLQGDDLLQLTSSGIPVLQLLAKHLGITSADVSAMVTKGKIDFATFRDAMEEGIGGAALSAGTTFSGALENVKAALSRLGENFGTPALDGLRETMNAAIPVIDNLTTLVTPLADALGQKLSESAKTATGFLGKLSDGLKNGSIGLSDIVSVVGQVAGGFAVLAGVGGNIGEFTSAISSVGRIGSNGLNKVTDVFSKAPAQLSGKFSSITTGLSTFFNKDLRTAAVLDGDPFATTVNEISQGSQNIIKPFTALSGKVGNIIAPLGTNIAGYFASIGEIVSTKIQGSSLGSIGTTLLTNIQGGLSSVGSGLNTIFSGIFSTISNNPITAGIGQMFSGLGGLVSPALQGFGSVLASFFNPTNIMNFIGIGAIIAALIAGLGMIDASMNGQLTTGIDALMAQLPGLIAQGTSYLVASLPLWLSYGSIMLETLMNGITTAAPQLAASAGQILSTLLNGLAVNLPQLVPAALTMIVTLVGGLIAQLPQILAAGMNLLLGLVQGLMNALPQLINKAPQIIGNFVSNLAANLPQILATGMKILATLANGLSNAIPLLISKLPAIISNIKNAFTSVNWGQLGLNIIKGIANGVAGAASSLFNSLKNLASNALNAAKNALGIHSPSTVFRDEVGRYITLGIARGVMADAATLNNTISSLVDIPNVKVSSGLGLDANSNSIYATSQLNAATETNNLGSKLDMLISLLSGMYDNLGDIIAEYTPSLTGREYKRSVTNAVSSI